MLNSLIAAAAIAGSFAGQQALRPTLEQRLAKTEAQLQKMAAGHEKTMRQMRQIEATLDALVKKLREAHQKIRPQP